MSQLRGQNGQEDAEPSPFGQERKSPLDMLKSFDPRTWFSNFKLPSWKFMPSAEGAKFTFDEAVKSRIKTVVLWLSLILFIGFLTLSPLLIKTFLQQSQLTPNWWQTAGQQVITTDFRPTPPSWPVLMVNFWYFLPWMVWSLSVPVLLWILKKERTEAREISDFWAVLVASTFFLAVRFYPTAFGAFGGQVSSWFTGIPPHIWGTPEVVPAAALLGAFIGLVVSFQGQRDMTSLSVILIIEAVIWKAFDTDMSWPRLLMTAGLVLSVYEVLKTPKGPRAVDRAGIFGMTVVAVLIYSLVRNISYYLIKSNIESIASVPEWYLQFGQIIWQNANIIAVVLGITAAWLGRGLITKLMVKFAVKVIGVREDINRLAPADDYRRQWDGVLLFVAAVLALWLYTGSL